MYQKTTLENGLRLVTANMPHTRSVSIGFFIGAGSRYENETQAGISHFIEHLCFKGTDLRPTSTEICEAIEGVGGVLNAGTDKELTVYWCKVAQPHFAIALEVLSDMLLNSAFNPVEIERERQVIIEEINMTLDSPAQRVMMLIDELSWPEHPLGRDIAGSKDSVAAITRDMIMGYMKQRYQPGNTVLAVAGGIECEAAAEMAARATAGWSASGALPGYLEYDEKPGRRVLIENRDTEQSQLCLSLPGLPLTHPERFKLDLLNVVLGEGMSSRLFTEIRDKLGLAYSIHSYTEHFLDTGSLTVSAGVDTGNLELAVKATLDELNRLKEEVPATELTKAKELFKGRILLRLEDSRSVAGWMGGQEILTGEIISVDDIIARVDAISAEELTDLAARLLTGDKLRLAVVGPVDPDAPLEDLLKL